jgi:Sulfotransferase domain/Glycosyl transferases group 1
MAHGIGVIPYPSFSYLKMLSVDAVCNDILGTALDVANKIDCVVFVDGLYFRGERARVPQSLRRAGIPTVLIATDDPYETIPNVESLYTYRFTNEICCATDGVVYLPTATLPQPRIPCEQSPAYDVSFLGSVFPDRLPLLLEIAEFCEEKRLKFLIAGKFLDGTAPFDDLTCTEVRHRTITNIEKWEIYSQSRVTINLFRESETPAESPSPRIFEVTEFGHAALLTGPLRNEVTREFGDSLYYFEDAESAKKSILDALADTEERMDKVERAQQITRGRHLYDHRAESLIRHIRNAERVNANEHGSDDQLAWIIGCGRTGSTWLAEMMGDLPGIRRWHEPYFGRFFRHLSEQPKDVQRRGSFFFHRHEKVWVDGLRDLFFRMVRERYPKYGDHALVVKEVNTPELYPWLRTVFPSTRLILLLRDPFDVLDSYLDMQKPGAWNEQFADSEQPLVEASVRRTCEHIRSSILAAQRAFDSFPLEQRLSLRYEELLEDPVSCLQACAGLLSTPVTSEQLDSIVSTHQFDRYEATGELEFRRKGRSGGWMESANFNASVSDLAEEVLGAVRARLGYTTHSKE